MGLDPERCLCGCSVHTGTLILAASNIILNASAFFVSLVFHGHSGYMYRAPSLLELLPTVITLVVSIMLLYGNLTKRPSFYWPYMIVNAIGVISTYVVGIICLILGLYLAITGNTLSQSGQDIGGTASITGGLMAILFASISLYLLSVIDRSRRLLEQNNTQPVIYKQVETREKEMS